MAVAAALSCPNCGGTIQLRGYAQTLNAVCEHCFSVLDTRSSVLRVLQTAQVKERVQPLIPLGSRGTFEGVEWEAIGFQERTIFVEGVPYAWREYLLLNPYQGYRYLSEYDGHWNYIRTLRLLPEVTSTLGRQAVRFEGRTYSHFQSASAETTYVIGEFPWQVRFGDKAQVNDFVNSPQMVSSETTPEETTWSVGTYTPGADIWQAFKLQGRAPDARGVFSNQPSPYSGRVLSLWARFFMLLLALALLAALLGAFSPRAQLFEQRYSFAPASITPAAFVTPVFEVKGDSPTVDVRIDANVREDAGFTISLINDESGQAWDSGSALDESKASVSFSRIPGGRYYLRVEPEMDASPYRTATMNYTLRVTQGGIAWLPLAIAAVLLAFPPVAMTARSASFESARWRESDYGTQFGPARTVSSEEDD